MTLQIDAPAFLTVVYGLAVAVALYLLARRGRRRLLAGVLAAVGGALLGWSLVWLLDDAFDVFGVGLTPTTTAWVAAGVAGVALAVANLVGSRWWRKAVAAASIPLFLLAAFAGVNVDFGAYRTLDDAFGVVPYRGLDLHHERGEVVAGLDWAQAASGDPAATAPPANGSPATDVPANGEVGTVRIPGTRSHFPAREAVVYLPPVALTEDPPVLPVMYAFSGQPGAPADMFTAGRVAQAMDAFAADHHGYAPIVVAADQLGGPGRNPMCVDSRTGGDAATYLLVDVRAWITSHLRVSSDPAAWTIFGYSQGATCAVQFATGHPEQFGSALASSSELGPTLGDERTTIDSGFGGSRAAYEAAQPSAELAAHTPYRDSLLVLGVGQNDERYLGFAHTLHADAEKAGMRTELLISPGTAHDWNTVRYTLRNGFPAIAAHLGLGS